MLGHNVISREQLRRLTQRRPRVLRVASPPVYEAGPRVGPEFCPEKVVLFVHFSTDAQVSLSVQTLLEQFSEHAYAVLMASSATCEGPLQWPRTLPPGVTVYRRPNIGYDFGSWAALMALHPGALRSPAVLVVNDSFIGPFRPIPDVLANFEQSDTDVWALTSTEQDAPHLQSHWLGYHHGLLATPVLRRFWRNIRVEPTKRDIVVNYEIGQSRMFAKHGFTVSVMYPFRWVTHPGGNPTSGGWRRLLAYGFPFVKREIVLRPPPEVPDGFEVPAVLRQRFDIDVQEWV